MTGQQKSILGALALLVFIELCAGGYVAYTRLLAPNGIAGETAQETPTPVRPTMTATAAPIPTLTFTPTPLVPPTPTTTATRVVVPTDTPTITPTPTETATPTASPSPTYTRVIKYAQPTAVPANLFRVTATQSYTTTNSFFVMFAQIRDGGNLAAGYRLVGTHNPSGLSYESQPSCPDLCEASGPKIEPEECCNSLCTPTYDDWEDYTPPPLIQEGNVKFEAPIYETGSYTIKLLDPQGQQVSETVTVPIDYNDRRWFFYVFSR